MIAQGAEDSQVERVKKTNYLLLKGCWLTLQGVRHSTELTKEKDCMKEMLLEYMLVVRSLLTDALTFCFSLILMLRVLVNSVFSIKLIKPRIVFCFYTVLC